jgi:hypothetical protein
MSLTAIGTSFVIALSLVDHASFMEKGEVRFDGAAKDLLARDDLLRAVFLESVSEGCRDGGPHMTALVEGGLTARGVGR